MKIEQKPKIFNDMKTKQDLLKKIESGVLQTAPWRKPLVLLIEDGDVLYDIFSFCPIFSYLSRCKNSKIDEKL